MSSPSHAYLFLELTALVYLVGFGGRYLQIRDFANPLLFRTVAGLVALWFIVDQIAVGLDLWTFPANGSLRVRFLDLPLEECMLLILHPFVCYALVQRSVADK